MAIRSIEELEAFLTEELKWRKQELDNCERMILQSRAAHQTGAIRGGLALIYAHWEGYVKDAARAYLEYIARQGLKIGDLRDEIAAVAMRSLLGLGEQSKKSFDHTEIVSRLRNERVENAAISYSSSVIRTNSNLNYERFGDIMHSIGCDHARHEIQRNTIDQRLLASRNNISHGRYLVLESEDWCEIKKRIVEVLEDVRMQIKDSARHKAYKRSS